MSVENIKRKVAAYSRQAILIAEAEPSDGAVMRILWCNPAFRRMTGYSQREIVGNRGNVLAGAAMPAETHLRIIEKLMRRETFEVVTPNNRKDGSEYVQSQHWVPIIDDRSGRQYWILYIAEVDEFAGVPLRRSPVAPGAAMPQPQAQPQPPADAAGTDTNQLTEWSSSEKRAHLDLTKADHDALTGALNRHALDKIIAHADAQGPGRRTTTAVLFVDLDNFKFINDNFGHDFGDGVLRKMVAVLQGCTRKQDHVLRLGGDEFLVIVDPCPSALFLSTIADRVVERVRKPMKVGDKVVSCTVSIGLAIGDETKGLAGLISSADFALYRAKQAGRNRWSMYDHVAHAEATRTRRLATELGDAIESGQLIVYYQPQLAAADRSLAGMEALVRWNHPEDGIIGPDAFLPIAERLNLIGRLDKSVLEQVARDIRRWSAAGFDVPPISVNVSAKRLRGSELAQDIASSGVPIGGIAVEILESVYVDDCDEVTRWSIDQLKEMGVAIDIDDFGSGHASILGLLTIEPRHLKIDRKLIRPIIFDDGKRELVRSIVEIGHRLGISVVAEGTESEAHLDMAAELGCDVLQGYAISRPVPADQAEAFLAPAIVPKRGTG